MRVFITGATGFVGSAVVQELIARGHQVLGLSRNEANAAALTAAGAQPYPGDLADLESLRSGAASADAVIHCGFNHDFANFAANCAMDQHAIEALGEALEGSNRPLLVTSGVALLAPGRIATEADRIPPEHAATFPRRSEPAADALAARGINAAVLRLPPSVHGDGDHGFVPILINIAREKGSAAYAGEGLNRWPAVHRLDAAVLYRLALEKLAEASTPGARFHAIAEEGVPFKDIAAVIGRRLDLPVESKSPEEAAAHFGWFAMFAGIDATSSSRQTRDLLGWQPTHRGLIEDIDNERYFKV